MSSGHTDLCTFFSIWDTDRALANCRHPTIFGTLAIFCCTVFLISCRSFPYAIEPHDPKWPWCHHDGLVQGLINILTSLVRKPILATTHVWQSVWPLTMAYLLNLGNQPGHLMLDSSFLNYNPVGSSQHQLSPSPYIRRLIISTLGNKHHVRVWFGFHIIISQNNITCQYNKYYLHIYIALWLWQSSISYHIISIYIYIYNNQVSQIMNHIVSCYGHAHVHVPPTNMFPSFIQQISCHLT